MLGTRRHFLKSAAMLSLSTGAALSPRPAAAAPEFIFKLSNNVPESHPSNIRAREMAANIAAESKGRVELQIYPNSQLGSDTDTLSQVRSGAIDFVLLSPLILGTLVSTAQVSNIGFAFRDYDQVWSAMDGALGTYVRQKIAATSSIFAFEKIWDNGYRNVTNNIVSVGGPNDLRGLKIRVMPSPLAVSVFKAFDAAPVSLNWSETYTALQTKVVDAQENPLIILSTNKIYEVQRYCSLTRHIWDGFWCLGNSKSFARLPEDLQAIMRKHINNGATAQRADLQRLNGTLIDELKSKGMQINEVQIDPFRQKLREAGFYKQWHAKFGEETWSELEKQAGKLS